MTKLYRFKTNPKTIVRETSPSARYRYVKIVWSEAHELGYGEEFTYRMEMDNLQELTEAEALEVFTKIGKRGVLK